jgi:hypothetical protein
MSRKEKTQLLQKLKVAVKKVTSYFTTETISDECNKHIAVEEGLLEDGSLLGCSAVQTGMS